MKAIILLSLLVFSTHADIVSDFVANMVSLMNTTVNPCDDFYQYACGAWIARNPVPANITTPYANIPTITSIVVGNDKKLEEIVSGQWPIISEVYQSCMQPIEKLEAELIKTYGDFVLFIESQDVSTPDVFLYTVAVLNSFGTNAFLATFVQESEENPQENNGYFFPYGASLPAADYLDPNSTDLMELKEEIMGLFLDMESESDAKADLALVLAIEYYIANATAPPLKNDTIEDIASATGFDLEMYVTLIGAGWSPDQYVYVLNPDYLSVIGTNASNIWGTHSITRYLEWKVWQSLFSPLSMLIQCMNASAPDYSGFCANFIEGAGYPNPPPYTQDVVCRYTIHNLMTDYVGLIFSNEIVTDDVYQDIRNMTLGIQRAFNQSLSGLPWLDANSTAAVEFKLDNVIQIIGHPNKLDKYNNLTVDTSRFSLNLAAVLQVSNKYALAGAFQPFNRSDFEFDPLVVNAFYYPITNSINFPAGILESPMFNANWPKLFQYARLGYVVGHENTHGFDNSGSQFNAYGEPIDIFDATTLTKFNASAQCIADYYSTFIQFNSTYVNGQQTLGENIADIGGVKNSFRAYQDYIAQNGPEFKDYALVANLTTNQVFFLIMGQTWCTSENIQYLEFQYADDVHSPSKWRVIGPLSQFDQFATTFNCPANTTMNPSNRCLLW